MLRVQLRQGAKELEERIQEILAKVAAPDASKEQLQAAIDEIINISSIAEITELIASTSTLKLQLRLDGHGSAISEGALRIYSSSSEALCKRLLEAKKIHKEEPPQVDFFNKHCEQAKDFMDRSYAMLLPADATVAQGSEVRFNTQSFDRAHGRTECENKSGR